MSTETPVWIDGPRGRIFAIVHRPERPIRGAACLIMLNAGQSYRAGPRRLYLRAARAWVARGITIIRLDLAGIGDSQADNSVVHMDNHLTTDVEAAIAYARDTLKADRIFLEGLCAGARVAFRSAAAQPLVSGILALSCPIFHSGNLRLPLSPGEDPARMSSARAKDNLRQIRVAIRTGRIFTAAWWRNRQNSYLNELRTLWRSAFYLVRGGEHATTYFLECTDQYLRSGRPALFVYGEHDRVLLGEFKERFADVPGEASSPQSYAVIADAVHHFASIRTQEDVIAVAGAWLTKELG